MMDFGQAIGLIESAQKVLLTTHVRPDGDAVGSVAALARVIGQQAQKAGRDCSVQTLLLSAPGANYEFLLDGSVWYLGDQLTAAQVTGGALDEFDLVVVVDTSAVRQLPEVGEYLAGRAGGVMVIDHHLAGERLGDCRLIDSRACAAGEIVFDLCRQAGWELDRVSAEALLAAIGTDTGWFRFENSSARAYAIAGELVAAGARPQEIYRELFETFPPARLKLVSLALQSVQLHCQGRLAVMKITKDILAVSGASRSHIENVVNECGQVGSLSAWVLLVEQEDGGTRCSLRSRAGFDVNAVAGQLGGGGHARAAGVTLEVAPDQAERIIVDAMGEALAAG